MFVNIQPMSLEIDEEKFIQLLKDKNNEAQTLFVKTYYSNMFAIAHRYLENKEDVEDILQESFMNALKKIDQFEGRSSLKTWLTTIVINNCLMNLRNKKNKKEHSIEEFLPTFDENGARVGEPKLNTAKSVDEIIHDREKREKIKEALDMLPTHYKAILLLRDIDGYSVRETAALLELSEANVKSKLHRARAALKKLLESIFKE